MSNAKFCLLIGLLLVTVFAFGCEQNSEDRLHFDDKGQSVPSFDADSAYQFIDRQVAFGPRNPGSTGHREAKKYLVNKLQDYAGKRSVFVQEFTSVGYEGDTLKLSNIIAAFNPQSSDRIMLCAHWDSRPRADQDTVNIDEPIIGADDGGSGVAVLLELARLFKKKSPPLGVDIILLDGEDYGKEGNLEKYFLGSRYWSENPPVKGYSPRFGILLDMVGGVNAQFPKEGYSMRYAPALVNEIWSIADEKGYNKLFPDEQGHSISDDHVVINQTLGIPTIDIIRHTATAQGAEFAPYWHTHRDNMQIIRRETLDGVGRVLTELIYNRVERYQ